MARKGDDVAARRRHVSRGHVKPSVEPGGLSKVVLDIGADTRRVTSPAPARVAFPATAREPARMHDLHVSDTGWLADRFWSVISSMPGPPPPGAPGCSPSTTRPGGYGGAG